MGKSLIIDLEGTFGHLLRGFLRGAGHEATLVQSLDELVECLRLEYHDAAFFGDLESEAREVVSAARDLRRIHIGSGIGVEEFCDEVLERPIQLRRLASLTGRVLATGKQRRRHRRHAVELQGGVRLAGKEWTARVTDLALGGMSLFLDLAPEPFPVERGNELEIRFRLPGLVVEAPTRVAYRRKDDAAWTLGLRFEELTGMACGRLREYLLCA